MWLVSAWFIPASGHRLEPSGLFALLHRHKHIRLDGQHGEDHEGPGLEGQLHHGLHGSQEAPGGQPGPSHHRDAPPESRSRQERQICEGSGDPAVRDGAALLGLHAGRPTDALQPHLQDDQARVRWVQHSMHYPQGCNDTILSEPIRYRKFWGSAETDPIPAQVFLFFLSMYNFYSSRSWPDRLSSVC